jgi:DNA-binding response OmpR family regulator
VTNKPIIVLLIEDNPDDALLIQVFLSKAMKVPYEVTQVDRISKGVECLEADAIDIVLLDFGLPDGQGLDTFETVHKHARDVPIIVLTGHDDDEIAVESVQRGAQDYLVKGKIDGSLLSRAIRYAIERQKLHTQLEHSTREIRALRGFLPICAGCKKIRDDKGYWTQIEAYISEHSEAEFSHSICPECMVRLYGQDYLKKK